MTASNPVAGIWAAASEETREHARRYREDLNRITGEERNDFEMAQAQADDEKADLRRELARDEAA